jgi:GT2 family glycosyltransferase
VERLANLYNVLARVVSPGKNLGFSGINNFAVDYAKGEYLLFLNSDCFVSELEPLTKAINWLKNPKNGAVGFRLMFADKTVQHDGMSVSKWNNSSDFYLNDHPNAGLPVNLMIGMRDKFKSTMLTAACLMMSKVTFREVGCFNRAYFRGDFEDSDLCLKIIAKGKRLGIVQDGNIYHLERQTIASQEPGLRQKITLVNSYIYSQRWKSMLSKNLPLLEVVL